MQFVDVFVGMYVAYSRSSITKQLVFNEANELLFRLPSRIPFGMWVNWYVYCGHNFRHVFAKLGPLLFKSQEK